MRLLDTETLQLRYFPDGEVPPYAILSHTWGKEEVTFEDLKTGKIERNNAAYNKIQQSSNMAARNGFLYIWIDTCCIDKSSSAELSEAINSMYRYYEKAEICYAYLADVPYESQMHNKGNFAASRWFSRGWTLQELIAPKLLVFLSSDWRQIGTKESLALDVEQITGVELNVLHNAKRIHGISIAKRMSWASKRKTTREEDIAYCLLGIFNVNMPLLYGEGSKAFLRLQEEIMKDSTDQSLFAWSTPRTKLSSFEQRHKRNLERGTGVLAKHPAYFAEASDIVPYQANMEPYTMTNKGLQIKLPVFNNEKRWWQGHIAILSCHVAGNFFGPIGIVLELAEGEGAGVYVRSNDNPEVVSDSDRRKARVVSIYILKEKRITVPKPQYAWLRSIPLPTYGFKLDILDASKNPSSSESWDISARTMLLSNSQFGAVILKHQEHPWIIINFGVHSAFFDFREAYLFIDISVSDKLDDLKKSLEDSRKEFVRRHWDVKPWNSTLLATHVLDPHAYIAYTDIIPGIKVTATISMQEIMDSQLLVLDIEARHSLLRESVSYLGSTLERTLKRIDLLSTLFNLFVLLRLESLLSFYVEPWIFFFMKEAYLILLSFLRYSLITNAIFITSISSTIVLLCVDQGPFFKSPTISPGSTYVYVFSLFYSSFIRDRAQFLLFILYSLLFVELFTHLKEPWCSYLFEWGLHIEH